MSILNFPTSPSTGDLYTFGDYTYRYDGEKWTTISLNNVAILRADLANDSDPAKGAALVGYKGRTVADRLADNISIKDFGAVGDGVTDDSAAFAAAAAFGGVVHFPNGLYKVSGVQEMPRMVSGVFSVIGDVKWSFKKEVRQSGQISVSGTVLIDSVWESKFDHLESTGNFTLLSSSPSWGTFWNDFGMVRCAKLIIDVDGGQSVNQNTFNTVRCPGVHIRGVAVSGVREAHNNVFINLDTTGANMTAVDGTTGVHLLNDSNRNQANTVINWYAESTGLRYAYGNWNILGSNIDATSGPYLTGRNNSALFSGGTGRNGAFLSASVDIAKGDWAELGTTGIPLTVSGSAIAQAATAGSPDGNPYGAKQTGGATYRAINIKYPLGLSPQVRMTAFVYQEGAPSQVVELYDGAGALVTSGVASYTPLSGGWYLLRVFGAGGKSSSGTTGTIRIYTTIGSALTASDFRILGSFYVTTEQTALLPMHKTGRREAFGLTAPTAGAWRVGDVCWHTAPLASGTPGWVCTAAGAPGTWNPMAVLGP